MKARAANRRGHVRIVAAIAAKDILEAVRWRNCASILLISLLMAAFYRWMPSLLQGSEPLNVLVFDAGHSRVVAGLKESRAITVHTFDSAARMKALLAEGELVELGLIVPAGIDAAVATGKAVTLDGYLLHWVGEKDAAQARRTVEAELERVAGRPVPIELAGHRVVPGPQSDGLWVQAGFGILFVVVMIGVALVANLMLEEKQNRTIDALLVSPAGAGHLMLGKSLAGLFYCLLGSAVALLLNKALILHWWPAVSAVVAGSLFTVAAGLWLGAASQDRGQMMILSWFFLLPLLLPVFLSLEGFLLPAAVTRAMSLVPTVAMFRLLRLAFAEPVTWQASLPLLGILCGWSAAGLGIVVWQVRRLDRESGPARRGLWRQRQKAAPAASEQPAGTPSIATPERRPGLSKAAAWHDDAARAQTRPAAGWRIVLAIAGKDLAEAMRNRVLLGILLGVGVMIGSNLALPLLLRGRTPPSAVVYDEGSSAVAQGLRDSRSVRAAFVRSRQEMEREVSQAPTPRLGLVIPADFDRRIKAGKEVVVQAYLPHWASRKQSARLQAAFEEQISLLGGRTVRLDAGGAPPASDHRLYPAADAGGQPILVATLIAIVLATLGTALVPLLLVEEKESRTMDVLLASPASLAHVVAGKALAGWVYCLIAGVVLLAVHQQWFVSWGTAAGALLLGTVFVVAVGLVLGLLTNSPLTESMWGVGVLLALIGLTTLALAGQASWPGWLRTALAWTPGALTVNLLRFSMAGTAPPATTAAFAASLAAESGALYLLVIGLLRRHER